MVGSRLGLGRDEMGSEREEKRRGFVEGETRRCDERRGGWVHKDDGVA